MRIKFKYLFKLIAVIGIFYIIKIKFNQQDLLFLVKNLIQIIQKRNWNELLGWFILNMAKLKSFIKIIFRAFRSKNNKFQKESKIMKSELEDSIPSLIQIQSIRRPLPMAENMNKFSLKNSSKEASIANLNEKIMQKLEFMPHFSKDVYDFMIPEGLNQVFRD